MIPQGFPNIVRSPIFFCEEEALILPKANFVPKFNSVLPVEYGALPKF